MRKLFTIDDFMVAFISALGYGYGETIARLSGWSEVMCVASCVAVGIGQYGRSHRQDDPGVYRGSDDGLI